MGCNGRNGYVTVNSSAPGLNVKKNPYCCSVVTVNNKNSVQLLTFGCSKEKKAEAKAAKQARRAQEQAGARAQEEGSGEQQEAEADQHDAVEHDDLSAVTLGPTRYPPG